MSDTQIQIQFKDANKFLAEVMMMLRAQGKKIASVPPRAIRRGTFALLAAIQRHTPKKTSTLVRSLTGEVREVSPTHLEGKVGSPLPYARFIEEGTGVFGPKRRPILVIVKNKKALNWGAFDEKTGRPIFRRRVLIQGVKPQRMFAKGAADFTPKYLEIIDQELKKEAVTK